MKACGADTWDSVRNLVKQETEVVDTEFASDVARFDIDKEELEKNLQNLRGYARNLVEKEASLVAKDVSMIMQNRYNNELSDLRFFFFGYNNITHLQI